MLNVSAALKNPGQAYPLDLTFSFDPVEIMGDEVRFSPVRFQGEYMSAKDEVSLSGTVTASAHSRCANCLADVTVGITAQLDAQFARGGDGEDQYPLEGYEIDPAPAVREAVLLELPIRFLCREDCKGICPVCGKNRNTDLCTCHEGSVKPNPFSALSSLLYDQNNEEV